MMWVITKQNPLKGKPYLNIKKRIFWAKKMTNKEKKIYVKYYETKLKSSNTYSLLNYLKKIGKKKNYIF